MSLKYERLHSACEEQIREGRVSEAVATLRSLEASAVPRAWKLRFANLCRRTGLTNLGLNLLRETVRPSKLGLKRLPRPEEVAEYALLLNKVGAGREALLLLAPFAKSQSPETQFALAFCWIGQWEYENAIPFLETYIALTPTAYAKTIGRVNLAAACAAIGRDEQALEILDILMRETEENKWVRLQANCFEIRAQVSIDRGEFDKAEADLAESARRLAGPTIAEPLHVKKWQAVIKALRTNTVAPLLEFRWLAVANKDWFAVRDVDMYRMKIKTETEAYKHLYFGSPSAGYRRHVEQIVGRTMRETSYTYQNGDGGPRIDLRLAQLATAQTSVEFKASATPFRLFEILLRDFYAPFSIGSLFSHLFENDYFDVRSSPERVRQVIYRTRRWLRQEEIPVQIIELNGNYKLELTGPISITVGANAEPRAALLGRLQNRLGPLREFTAREARTSCDLSYGSWHRFISWAVENGHIEQSDLKTRAAFRYRFKLPATIEKAAA